MRTGIYRRFDPQTTWHHSGYRPNRFRVKSTTLYAALSEINTKDRNILTVEDPIEYDLKESGKPRLIPKWI